MTTLFVCGRGRIYGNQPRSTKNTKQPPKNSSQQMDVQNPFRFNFIRTCRAVYELDDFQPAVVLASPGFLNSGPSRHLFDR